MNTELERRFPGAISIPRESILENVPSEVRKFRELSRELGSELWLKDDSTCATPYAGNKARKLEYLLGDARQQGADTLVTVGASGSHHALATSIYGNRLGFDVHVLTMPQVPSDHVRENEAAMKVNGAKIHPLISNPWALRTAIRASLISPIQRSKITALLTRLRLQGRHPYFIPTGGSNAIGTLGYVEAGFELAQQIDQGLLPEPHAIVVALGSCGTIAGLALGLSVFGITSQITGVRVTPKSIANQHQIKKLIHATAGRIRRFDSRFPQTADHASQRIEIDHDEVGPGYGIKTPAGLQAIEQAAREELELDDTYTAKAFAGFLRIATRRYSNRRILYWHTLNRQPLASIRAKSTANFSYSSQH